MNIDNILSKSADIDKIDFEIICLLETRGKIPIKEVASELNISISNVSNRLNRMEKNGLLLGYFPLINHSKLNFSSELIALIQTDPNAPQEVIIEELIKCKGVKSLIKLIGEHDYLIQICCVGTKELESILDEISKISGIKKISKELIARKFKENFQIIDSEMKKKISLENE